MAKINREVKYPIRWFTVDDLLGFIELSTFKTRWEGLGLNEGNLGQLQIELLSNPLIGKVIKETAGLRKMRFRPHGSGKGKSGSLRICYVFLEAFSLIILVSVYAKSEKADLSAQDKRLFNTRIATVIRLIEKRNRT